MLRTLCLVMLIGLLSWAAPAQAQTVQDRIVTQLTAEGFSDIRVSRTWLGRVRIVAEEDGTRREVVINPANGLILRDFTQVIEERDDDGTDPSAVREEDTEAQGNADDGEDEDEDQDEGDDEDEDDDDEDDDDDDDEGDDDD